jgi:acetyl-CoA carboxylase carboxyltransferase component
MTSGDEFEKITTWKMGMPWEAAIEEMRLRREAVKRMGGKERIARHHDQGKLTIRERIDRLVDKDTFFEVGSLMGRGIYDENGDIIDFLPGAFVEGLAEIDGRQVTVGGEDFTISGGSPAGMHKDARLFMQPMSLQYGIPLVQLCDGAGASAASYEGSGQKGGGGGRMSLPPGTQWWWDVQLLQKVPVVSAVVGSCAGHVAARAVLSHFSIMVKGTGQIFPAGPPVVSRALSENTPKDDLGGTRRHTHETGVIDNEAEDEEDAFRQIRGFLSYMPDNVYEVTARKDMGDDPNRREEELLGIVPINRKRPYDMYKVIRLLVDKGEFFEMRKYYGAAVITAFARMDGYVVGVLASNPMVHAGAMIGKAAQKMARFIDLCNCFSIPLLLLGDVPGFMIGSEAEREGTMRYGMVAVMAAQEASVPKVHIALRKSYGMGGDAFSSAGGGGMMTLNLRLGWPSGEWGAIPIEGGVAAAYRRVIESAPDPEEKRKELEEKLVGFRSPFRAAEAGDVIDIIDPRDTRSITCRFIRAAQPALKRNAGPKRSVRP